MKTKRLLAVFLIIAVFSSLVSCAKGNGPEENTVNNEMPGEPVIEVTNEATTEDGLYDYGLADGGSTVFLKSYNGKNEKSLTVPDTINSLPVKYIGSDCFAKHSELEEITLPDSVEIIESYAFNICDGLKKVTLPKNLTEIREGTFSQCATLHTAEIPSTVKSIGEGAFYNCASLKTSLPESLVNIYDYAFYGCISMEVLYFADTVEKIGLHAFSVCPSVSVISFGENSSIKELGDYAFNQCEKVETLTLPDSLISLSNGAFANCTALAHLAVSGLGSGGIGDGGLGGGGAQVGAIQQSHHRLMLQSLLHGGGNVGADAGDDVHQEGVHVKAQIGGGRLVRLIGGVEAGDVTDLGDLAVDVHGVTLGQLVEVLVDGVLDCLVGAAVGLHHHALDGELDAVVLEVGDGQDAAFVIGGETLRVAGDVGSGNTGINGVGQIHDLLGLGQHHVAQLVVVGRHSRQHGHDEHQSQCQGKEFACSVFHPVASYFLVCVYYTG